MVEIEIRKCGRSERKFMLMYWRDFPSVRKVITGFEIFSCFLKFFFFLSFFHVKLKFRGIPFISAFTVFIKRYKPGKFGRLERF